MTRDAYKIKYRTPGSYFWRTIKNVIGDEITFSEGSPLFRSFQLSDGAIRYIPLDSEVIFPKERQDIIAKEMSRSIGQPIQRV